MFKVTLSRPKTRKKKVPAKLLAKPERHIDKTTNEKNRVRMIGANDRNKIES